MEIKRLAVGEMEANCYLVWDREVMEGIVIDPGDEGDFVSEMIVREGFTLTAIVLTHGHFDHVLGVLEVKLNFNVPVLMNEADEFLYKKANKSAKYWGGDGGLLVPKIDRYIKEGEEVMVGNERLVVMETPGHTPGGVSLWGEAEEVVFTGDTLFADGVGRTDLSYSRPMKLAESLERLRGLPAGTRVLAGHGEESVLG